jgi:hypothetical protein
MRLGACLALLSICFVPAHAQSRGSWNNISILDSGQKIQVRDRAGNQSDGKFVAASLDDLTVRYSGREVVIPRADVSRVRVRSSAGRLKNGGIGAAIGGGVTSAIVLISSRGEEKDSLYLAVLVVLGAMGATAGFVVGLLPAAWKTVYEA